jgi:hypothetical protein
MDLSALFWIILIVAVAAAAAFAVYGVERRRKAALRQLAPQLGLSFVEESSRELARDLRDFPSLPRQGARILNLMKGPPGRDEVALFDWVFQRGKARAAQTVALFRSRKLSLPDFSLRPEHLGHKIGSLVGYQDLDFEHFPRFSSSYLLQGQDESRVRALFTPSLLSFFEQHPGLAVDGSGDRLVFLRPNRRLKPDQWQQHLDEARRVLALFESL